VFEDINSTSTSWRTITDACLQRIDQLSTTLENEVKASKREKESVIPLQVLDDERNAAKYSKNFNLKVKSKNIKLSPTKHENVLLQRKKGTLEKAASLFFEEEKENKTELVIPPLLTKETNPPTVVPSILLPKGTEFVSKPNQEAKVEIAPTILPGSKDFILAASALVQKIPFGKVFLDDTIKRESEIRMKDHQLLIWSCKSISF
jgi:hypothetical protein